MNILLSLLTHSDFGSVLPHYIATYDTHSFLLLYPNFHVFSAFIANDQHLRQMKQFLAARFDHLITTYDPSISGIFLGNNNKSNESVFLFDEYTRLECCFFLEKN